MLTGGLGSQAIVQDVRTSTANSTVTCVLNAANAYTFTGSGVSTLGVNAIQVSLKSTQNCSMRVQQSNDNVNWDQDDSFNYYTSINNFGITTQAIGAYARIIVNSASITATVRLGTVLCPVVEALPRALSSEGNLKVGVYEIEDAEGDVVGISSTGELRTSTHVRLAGASFQGSVVDTNFWTPTVTVTATITQTGGVLTLQAGGNNSSALINSVRRARYVGGCNNYYRGAVRLPAITGTCKRQWGAFEATDGFYFQHDETLGLSIVCRKTSSDANIISSGAFNGRLGATYVTDSNIHMYEIHWSNFSTLFYIDGVFLHKFSATTATLTDLLTVQIGAYILNGGSTANANQLILRSSTINRIGLAVTVSLYKNLGVVSNQVLKYGAGFLNRFIIGSPVNSGTVTVLDANGGTNATVTIGTFAMGNQVNSIVQPTMEIGCEFYYGLVVTTVGHTSTTFIYE